ncbi:M15 family metallopeptidase [Alcanivoracaceae bacterium MT1]
MDHPLRYSEDGRLMFRFSARSERNLQGVHPHLVAVARRALELSEVDFGVTEGLRSKERQQALVVAGKSQTMNSRHLTGHAVDVMAYVGGHGTWEWRYYEQINAAFEQASEELGVSVEWGGHWRTLKDGAHFQLSWSAYR